MNSRFVSMSRRTASWLSAPGMETAVALSSRVRLARNLRGLEYPHSANGDTLERVVTYVAAGRERSPKLAESAYYRGLDLTELDSDFLVERHLISPAFTESDDHKATLIDPTEQVSIMVNEEDHLRVQAIVPGLNVRSAFKIADTYDDELCAHLEIDYDPDFGFLTACPTNVGTGMRASTLLHLPGLVLTREIDLVIARITKLGLAVRGFYGEGSDVLGNLFQISNQTTLGVSEDETLDNIELITRQIIDEELVARRRLISEAGEQIEDKIWRAFGILKYARSLSSEEVMNMLSAVRLGVSLGRIEFLSLSQVNELLLLSQPAHLQMYYDEEMDPTRRDVVRADLVREKLRAADPRSEP